MRRQVLKPRGLYAVTPDIADTVRLCQLVEASLQGGAVMVQYRNKSAAAELRHEQAMSLLSLCRGYSAPLIINDHIDLCLALDADGVHLGGEDGDIAEARGRLGSKLLGVSCYDQPPLALAARNAGADYVAFGSCFGSSTKPHAVHAPLALLDQARHESGLPVVAIGGITLDNAAQAIAAGADYIAVISALYMADDVRQTARQFSDLFSDR